MRREAQLIIPGLYLGPFQASIKLERMTQLGITHVLCVRDQKEASFIYPRFRDDFIYHTLEIRDSMDQNLISVIPECLRFIDEAINAGGTVLAHCNGGIALAPAIVVGYIMTKYNWSFENALSYVQSKRYCVSPMSFQVQLKEYEPIHMAYKMIQKYGDGGGGGSGKRSLAEDDDDDGGLRRKIPAYESVEMDMS